MPFFPEMYCFINKWNLNFTGNHFLTIYNCYAIHFPHMVSLQDSLYVNIFQIQKPEESIWEYMYLTIFFLKFIIKGLKTHFLDTHLYSLASKESKFKIKANLSTSLLSGTVLHFLSLASLLIQVSSGYHFYVVLKGIWTMHFKDTIYRLKPC